MAEPPQAANPDVMTTYTARTPVDLLAVVPHVIGFHPEESVVLLTFGDSADEDASPPFHARVDLPSVESEQRRVVQLLRDVVQRHQVLTVAVVVYTEDRISAVRFGDLIVGALDHDGVEVIEALQVDASRFYPLADPSCPGYDYDLTSHPLLACAALEGRVVHPSREALRESLVGNDDADLRAVADAATAFLDTIVELGAGGTPLSSVLAEHAVWLRQWLAEQLEDPGPIRADIAARVLVLTSFEALREVAWAPMSRATSRQHLDLWRGLVRRAPLDLRPGAGGLLAFAAWLAGDGALAWCAVDRCLEVDRDDPLARYVAALVEAATPPSVWKATPAESLRIFTAFG